MVARKTAMISSTARDLPMHRDQVRLGCERAGFAPHDMMENLPALDADAVKASLEMVERSDVYLGIFAYRYGTVPEGFDKSITEMEYDRAVALDKPRLIFFIHENHSVTGRDFDTGDGAAKLRVLKERIGRDRVAAFFKSPEDLRGHVVEALTALDRQLEEAGPEAASARALAELHRKISIPEAPQPYIAHPYTLLQTRDLVGRRAELNLLTDWVTKPDFATPNAAVLAIVAIGGMGKSAHAWKWFNQIAPNEMNPLAGRMWWSFYESDATFDNFLTRAVCYTTGGQEQYVRALPWQEREAALLRHVDENPFLFVLDGLERILIAYNRMDASMVADHDYDRQTANRVAGAIGVPTSAQSFAGQHRLRQTTDPRAGTCLQKLARARQSRFLITTRLYPSALQLPTGEPRPGCAAYFLRGLSNDDALALWRDLGVSGARGELLPIFNSVENHPMLVQALAGEVANYRKAPRDFGVWHSNHPQFDPASLPLVQSRTHILQFALEGLSREHREVLETIAGFRMPTSYVTLEALLVGRAKQFKNLRTLDLALTDLEDRGLIGWDREANRYDAHPIVRSVVWQLVEQKDKMAVMRALERHFDAIVTPVATDVTSLDQLTPAIERFHALVELGRLDDALSLFLDRISQAAYYRLSAHREIISWLEALLDADRRDADAKLSNKWIALSSLGQSYAVTGQRSKAVDLITEAKVLVGPKQYPPALHVNMATSLNTIGRLAEAAATFRRALIEARQRDDAFGEAVVLQEMSANELVIGNAKAAFVALRRAMTMFELISAPQSVGVACAFLSKCALDADDYQSAATFADQAWALAENLGVQRDFVRAALCQGEVAFHCGEVGRASERLHHALTRARGFNLVDFELPILVALAALDLSEGHPADAKSRLNEAWEEIERGPYPMVATDAYNLLTQVEVALGDSAAATDAAISAFKAAWCDGPPYSYARGLQQARAQLAALGIPQPDLPPFVPASFEPWPEVEINPKDENWADPDNWV
jgi:tetratricopeptide (TPR) repeat protein